MNNVARTALMLALVFGAAACGDEEKAARSLPATDNGAAQPEDRGWPAEEDLRRPIDYDRAAPAAEARKSVTTAGGTQTTVSAVSSVGQCLDLAVFVTAAMPGVVSTAMDCLGAPGAAEPVASFTCTREQGEGAAVIVKCERPGTEGQSYRFGSP